MDFGYAHKDTSSGERQTPTAQFNKIVLPKPLEDIRLSAFPREIPVSDEETLKFLCTMVSALKPQNILELGTAVGLSALAMSHFSPTSRITTVEKSGEFYLEAQKNFQKLDTSRQIDCILGDAGEVIKGLSGGFDFIFLDSAKAQYIKYLPTLKRLLKTGGVLLADDVLLFGYITGEVPKKRKMLAEHIKEYIAAVTADEELITCVLDVGNGVALSVKR